MNEENSPKSQGRALTEKKTFFATGRFAQPYFGDFSVINLEVLNEQRSAELAIKCTGSCWSCNSQSGTLVEQLG